MRAAEKREYADKVRAFALVPLALLVLAVGVADAGVVSTSTRLTVTFWPDGARPGEKRAWTLRCNPLGGTLRRPAVACTHLAAGGERLFAPVPKDSVCTEIYGGPQVGLVVGTVQGHRVWARIQRRDGCQTARWNRLSPWLLPPGGTT
jgi:Subtilisin inhibitor-like